VNPKQTATMCNNGKTQGCNSLNATQKINHRTENEETLQGKKN
jgi:hypothetical protein